MCKPRPTGSQQASISIPTRCRGGKDPRSAFSGGVLDRLQPHLLVAPAEVPNRLSPLLHVRSQLLDDRRWTRHRKQNARPSRDTLLRASITNKPLEFGSVLGGELDPSCRSSSHAAVLPHPRNMLKDLPNGPLAPSRASNSGTSASDKPSSDSAEQPWSKESFTDRP